MGQANLGSDFCEKHDVALGDVMGVLKTLVSSGKITQEDSDLFLAVISGKLGRTWRPLSTSVLGR